MGVARAKELLASTKMRVTEAKFRILSGIARAKQRTTRTEKSKLAPALMALRSSYPIVFQGCKECQSYSPVTSLVIWARRLMRLRRVVLTLGPSWPAMLCSL